MAGEIVENLSTFAWSARDLMEAARSASDDYARCERQLIALRLRAESLGGGTSAGSVGGTSSHDGLERRVVALADRGRELEGRMLRDEAVMDAACEVLYGDGDAGLSALVPKFWADALWWHYVQGETWARVGRTLGYSPQHLKDVARAALEVADACGLAGAAGGTGIAEDPTAPDAALPGETPPGGRGVL